MSERSLTGALALAAALVSLPLSAATIRGTVRASDGKPVADARVLLVEVHASRFTAEDGSYAFEDVPAGAYHIQVTSRGQGSVVAELTATEGDNVVDLRLSVAAHRESIVVTATRTGRGSSEVVQPVNVLDSLAIAEKAQATLGETLGQEPGVNQSFFGAGASRPVIRGQDGGRVRMLEDGLGTGDASETSPDHAVSVDPLAADQIEVLRGAATLLYGSAAVGGVVNVLDQRIPESLPEHPLHGSVGFRLGSVADERAGAAALNGRTGNVAWHLDTVTRETDDYEIPGAADVDGHDVPPDGRLANSDLSTDKLTAGLSYVWGDRGYVGAAITRFDTEYGIPGEAHEHADAKQGDEAGPRIDLRQRRVDVRGGLETKLGPFHGGQLSFAATDYRHQELEGAELASEIGNESWETRIELHNGQTGPLRGTAGLQYLDRDLTAAGEEAFLPPASATETLALFTMQQLRQGPLHWEFGLRLETQDNRATDRPSRDFEGWAGNAGLLWRAGERWSLGASLTHADRLPNTEELYSDGAHLATSSFEVGDPTLGEETAKGAELSIRRGAGGLVSGTLNVYFTRYDDYIFLEQQLDGGGAPVEVDGLSLYLYRQRDAEFRGYEVDVRFALFHDETHDFDLTLRSDRTLAELTDTGEALPRIPAQRYGLGLDYSGTRLSASFDVTRNEQVEGGEVAPSETPTDSSTVLNASVSYRIIGRGVVHMLMLRGNNLTDEDVRLHASRLKDTVPLPGRDLSLMYKLQF